MSLKIIILIGLIIGIVFLAVFGFGVKEIALKNMVENIPEYNCGKDNLCTSCVIEGHTCSCGEHTCECGNKSVDRDECSLL